jgi:hypothetical protein
MKTTRMSLLIVVALALSLMGVTVGLVQSAKSDKNANNEAKAPEAVLTAFQKAYPKATIIDISQETKEGKIYYEIESKDGGQRRDLLYLADGKVFEMEEAIKVADLPKEITSGLSAEFPKGEPKKAEKITRGSTIQYEVLLENGENNLEVLVDSGGKIISQASVSDNDEKVGDGEKDEADED